ncbi:MAG: permease-like cell division protein FtsX [Desulfobacteraceae bacterium]|nr:permease-like cell division protein FtsX [Desulfobacteraceae bacterium]
MSMLEAKRALRDIKNNKVLNTVSVLTISLSVFIVSAFMLFFINATDFLDGWRKGVRIIAYMSDGVSEPARLALIDAIKKTGQAEDIVFISKDAAFKDLKKKIGEQSSLLEGLDQNPLPDSLEITLKDVSRSPAEIEALAGRIADLPNVDDVEYAQKWLHRFNGVYNLFKITGGVLASIFFIATLLIIANTIRMIMYSRREEIEILRIVGADENFIRYPLFIEAILQGFLGGLIGIVTLFLAFILTVPGLSTEGAFSFFEMRFIPLKFSLAIVLCSMMIGWIGCYFSIRKFLKH